MFGGQSNFLQALGWAVLNSLWQMALLWMSYQLITALLPKMRSSYKSAMATSFVIAGFGWFAFTFLFNFFDNTGAETNGALALAIDGNESFNRWMNTGVPVASFIYLLLLIIPLFRFARNYRYVQLIREQQISKIPVEWRLFVRNTAERMGIRKSVKVWLSHLVTSPVTVGFLKPVILVPVAAISQLTPQQVEAVLLHELAHIRRFDYLLNLLVKFVQVILYYNPFVNAFVKIIECEREKSCDEMVVQFQYDAYGYASALLTLEKNNHLPAVLTVAVNGKRHDLLHRIECMLGVNRKPVLSAGRIAGIFAALICFFVLNALLLAGSPVSNQQQLASATHLSSPFYWYTGEENPADWQPSHTGTLAATNVSENATRTIHSLVNKSAFPSDVKEEQNYAAVSNVYRGNNVSPFMAVSLLQTPIAVPRLKNYQEAQVKEAISASRRILEDAQWKEVEVKIGDAMTSCEKEQLKQQYDQQMSKVNWETMEDRLRLAYNNIEWNKVNEELGKAIANIQIDSLQKAYSQAMVELCELQKELKLAGQPGIPDSDVSVKSIEQGKKQLEQALQKLSGLKTRKIVRL